MWITKIGMRYSHTATRAAAVSVLVSSTSHPALSQQQSGGPHNAILAARSAPTEEIATLEHEIGQEIPRPPKGESSDQSY